VAENVESRRPLKVRDKTWAKALASAISRTPVQPNWISLLSVVCGAISGFCLWGSGQTTGGLRVFLLIGAAAGIQLRLLCNLLDGMVAVEGGKKGKAGEIWNDLPDRFSDLMILVPVGYALDGRAFSHELGWCAGVLAVLTAYVRMLGGSVGLKQDFGGPMGKPQRMAVMTVACLFACFEELFKVRGLVLEAALVLIATGSTATIVLRLRRIVRELQAR
jgi:phosphatidylglycerophosphate synthase